MRAGSTSTWSRVTRTSAPAVSSWARGCGHAADEYGAVVDAAGTQSSLDDAVARVRPGGAVVVVATYWEPVTIGAALLTKEVRIVPSAMYGHAGHDHGGASEFEAAAALLAARPEVVDALVHHRFGLDDAPEAFRVAGDRAAGAIKVLLEP